MKNLLLTLFAILFMQQLSAQNVSISGKAIDDILLTPVEEATVYLSLKKDSSVVNYTITDKEGNFNLNLKPINEPVFFRITDDAIGEYYTEMESLKENIQLGEVKIGMTIGLNEAVITGAPPIRIKSDTLEFNASSFKVRPDANVEELLKQLPGVEIDEEGKITVNGKEVNQILVNGKPFFDKDGKIALQNLPADIINKVQVSDTKTKKEEISGQKASGNNASINLTIDENKNKGFMLKALAGYGTDERYESSMMLNYFKGNQRISILGSSNNINSTGFSMNEIFDNMGGGRNNSYWSSGDGSFGMNGMRFGGGSGITQSHLGGISYSDTWAKDIEFNGNYFYTQSDSKNNNFTRQENFTPNNIYTSESTSKTRNQSFNHNINTSIEVKIDSTSSIWFEPKYSYNKSKSSNTFLKQTWNEVDELANENLGETNRESLTQDFSNSLNYYKTFRNKMEFSLDYSSSSARNRSDETNRSQTYFYQNDQADDIRNQLTQNRKKQDKHNIESEFGFKVMDSTKLYVGAELEFKNDRDDQFTYDFDDLNQTYTDENEFLSMQVSSEFQKFNPYLAYRVTKDKLFISFNAGTQFLTQRNYGNYLANKYYVKQNYISPSANFNLNYEFRNQLKFYFNYNYEVGFASAQQILPIENLSNPLNTIVGNPDLNPNISHSLYAGFNKFNMQSRSGFNFYAGGTYNSRIIVNYREIDENFASTTTYKNVNDTYYMWAGFNFNKSFSKDSHKFRYSIGLNTNHSLNKGFVDGQLYEARNYSLGPRVNFNWDFGTYLTINPSYNLRYQITQYENYRLDETSNFVHNFKLMTTNYWPKNFVFGNDFTYTYNSNIADGFKKDFFLWNSSLAYNFWKDQLTFKIKVYDILNQNTGDRRTITDTSITDVQNDVLKRYVMFSLGFKLDKFGGGGGKRRGGGSFMFH
ncbi:TonB-dependent receptor [Moheibacter stercoris]